MAQMLVGEPFEFSLPPPCDIVFCGESVSRKRHHLFRTELSLGRCLTIASVLLAIASDTRLEYISPSAATANLG